MLNEKELKSMSIENIIKYLIEHTNYDTPIQIVVNSNTKIE